MKHYTSPRIQRAQLFLMKVSSYLEIACALILIVAICIAFIPVPQNLYSLYLDNGFDLSDFMKKSFDLVIGVELLKMFCRHDIDSIVEVLLFSVARQMVIEHLAIKEALIGCIAVALRRKACADPGRLCACPRQSGRSGTKTGKGSVH